MRFSRLPGHKDIIDKLICTVKEGRVSHAQLFTGPEGCGSLALAMAYAQYVSCENKGETDSCGVCKSCEKYQKMIHPDYHFVFPVVKTKGVQDPVSDSYIAQWRELVSKSPYFSLNNWLNTLELENAQGQISVNESAEVIRKLSLKPFESEFKIMIIWLPEKMHPAAANKLLKLIEEPPAKTLFLLVSNEPERVLPTILSRCQLVKIPAFTEGELAGFLVYEYKITPEKAKELAHISNGNILRAVEIVESSGDVSTQNLEWFKTIMRVAYARNIPEVIGWSESMASTGREAQKSFLGYGLRLLRENLMLTLDQKKNRLVYLANEEMDFSSRFHPFISEKNIFNLTEEFNLAYAHIEANGNAKIVFLDLGLRIVKLIR
jgi:DNA polymerase-3 subunit delta'